MITRLNRIQSEQFEAQFNSLLFKKLGDINEINSALRSKYGRTLAELDAEIFHRDGSLNPESQIDLSDIKGASYDQEFLNYLSDREKIIFHAVFVSITADSLPLAQNTDHNAIQFAINKKKDTLDSLLFPFKCVLSNNPDVYPGAAQCTTLAEHIKYLREQGSWNFNSTISASSLNAFYSRILDRLPIPHYSRYLLSEIEEIIQYPDHLKENMAIWFKKVCVELCHDLFDSDGNINEGLLALLPLHKTLLQKIKPLKELAESDQIPDDYFCLSDRPDLNESLSNELKNNEELKEALVASYLTGIIYKNTVNLSMTGTEEFKKTADTLVAQNEQQASLVGGLTAMGMITREMDEFNNTSNAVTVQQKASSLQQKYTITQQENSAPLLTPKRKLLAALSSASALAGAGAGSALGFFFGSFLFGIGGPIGAVIGGVIGLFVGAAAGLAGGTIGVQIAECCTPEIPVSTTTGKLFRSNPEFKPSPNFQAQHNPPIISVTANTGGDKQKDNLIIEISSSPDEQYHTGLNQTGFI
jgi:hypothetical protein